MSFALLIENIVNFRMILELFTYRGKLEYQVTIRSLDLYIIIETSN